MALLKFSKKNRSVVNEVRKDEVDKTVWSLLNNEQRPSDSDFWRRDSNVARMTGYLYLPNCSRVRSFYFLSETLV